MRARLTTWHRRLRHAAMGGAWFFIAFSLLHLVWVFAMQAQGAMGSVKLYHTTVGGVSYDAAGLTYSGWPGVVLGALEFVVVIGAVVASVSAAPRLRRVGHGILIAWAGLWAANLYWLASVDGAIDSVIQSTIMTALLGATIWRAFSRPGSRTRKGHDVGAPFDSAEVAPHAEPESEDGAPGEKSHRLELRDLHHAAASAVRQAADAAERFVRGTYASGRAMLARARKRRADDGAPTAETRASF